MGLFSKIKDLLVDDEEVYETKEVEVEEKEEEHKLPTFMRNKIEKEEEEKKILEEKTQKKEPIKENIPEVKKEEKKFPFEFDDDDFIENIATKATSINDMLTKIYYPIGAYIELITNFNFLTLIKCQC